MNRTFPTDGPAPVPTRCRGSPFLEPAAASPDTPVTDRRAKPDWIVSPCCHPGTMNDQMALLPHAARDDDASWELDDHTRHVGKQGLAAARQALEQACARPAA